MKQHRMKLLLLMLAASMSFGCDGNPAPGG